MNDDKNKTANFISDCIKKLDGVAAVNLAEPTKGDLERVVAAYRSEKERADKAEQFIEKMNAAYIKWCEVGNLELRNAKLQERVKHLLSEVEHLEKVADKYSNIAIASQELLKVCLDYLESRLAGKYGSYGLTVLLPKLRQARGG